MTGQAQASALSTINIQDTLTFSVDSLTGQLGLWTFSLLVDGSLSDTTSNAPNAVQSGWQVDIHARMTSGAGQSSNYFHNVADWADTPGTPFSRCNIDGVATSDYTDCASLFTISIPFTFGTPFDFFYQFRGSATSSPDTAVHVGDAVYDLSNSLLWGGTSSITAGGIVVTNYGFHSDSGFDWRQSSIPTNGIPEPASIALIGIGLAALAWTTRRSPEA